MAEGEWGVGRMAEPEEIFERVRGAARAARPAARAGASSSRAGGTREPLDAVRFVGNRSSGRMGVALAEEARRRGADVTLARGEPRRARARRASSVVADADRRGRRARGARARRDADVVVMAAAVADYRPAEAVAGKRPKDDRTVDGRARADDGRPARARRARAETASCSSASPRSRASEALERARAEAHRQERRPRRLQRRITQATSASTPTRTRWCWSGQTASGASRRRRSERIAGGDPRRGRRLLEERDGRESVAQAVAGRRTRGGRSSAIVDNLARVVHAPEETLRLGRPLPRQRGPPDHRGLPGRREDDAREGARALARRLVLPPPVHARPAAVRRHRRERVQPAHERVRVPPGPGLREPPARRRDQPRVAEDAVGAARVHAGEPGHGRRRHLRARAPVHGDRDAEPDRVRGHVPAARGAARPLHDAHRDRLPAARRGGADADRADERAAARLARAGRDAAEVLALVEEAKAIFVEESSTATSSRCCGTRAPTRACTSARARAPGIALLRVAKARALADGRDFLSPDDVKAVAEPVLAHRLIVAPEARSAGTTAASSCARRSSRRRFRSDAHAPGPPRAPARRQRSTSPPGRSARSRSIRSRVGLLLAVLLAAVTCACRAPDGVRRRSSRVDHFEGDDVRVELEVEPRASSAWHRSASSSGWRSSASTPSRFGRRAAYSAAATCCSRSARPLRVRRRRGGDRGPVRPRAGTGAVARAGSAARLPAARRARPALHRGRRRVQRRPSAAAAPAVRLRPPQRARVRARRVAAQGALASTARRGQLMVKELEDAPRDEVAVLLDAVRRHRSRAGASTCRCARRARSFMRTSVGTGARRSS